MSATSPEPMPYTTIHRHQIGGRRACQVMKSSHQPIESAAVGEEFADARRDTRIEGDGAL
eukprot:CAMPEP_0174713880 /NCGR_PEP_ID=MMETSP1094-20130205/15185_1 /TAXON_ID=156173 /ORGANISM="Chrysochromulina brevifilum, Strain UTEX LB 985" /LENGTH=59 /DNA_ID=CAMNT_0015913095 /DNA_START=72 /DNA_END=247 /DNA_ORIENTATION=+